MGGTAALPKENHSKASEGYFLGIVTCLYCISQRAPPSLDHPSSVPRLHLQSQVAMKLRKIEGKQRRRLRLEGEWQGPFLRPWCGKAGLNTRGLSHSPISHIWASSSSKQQQHFTELGLYGKPQGSYLAAQVGSEIAETGIQIASGQEPVRAAGGDGGKSYPGCGEIQTSQNLQARGTSSICLLPVCPLGLQTLRIYGQWPYLMPLCIPTV